MVRLLVLDGSRVLLSLVKRLAPEGVKVESAATFDEALKTLLVEPPDALIVNLSPVELPWRELQSLCERHSPPIPVLYESCVHHSPVEAGLRSLSGNGHFLEKPFSMPELRAEIHRLVELAAERSGRARKPVPPPRPRARSAPRTPRVAMGIIPHNEYKNGE